jgi:hypothetical protein
MFPLAVTKWIVKVAFAEKEMFTGMMLELLPPGCKARFIVVLPVVLSGDANTQSRTI